MGSDGNLYGTTNFGGNETGYCYALGCGTVFRMTRHGSGWIFSHIYEFNGADGDNPGARVVFGPNGTLYGTAGGGSASTGLVFNLQPPASICKSVSCFWNETVLFSFPTNNSLDLDGDLAFDAAGNIYGTSFYGGNYRDCDSQGCGTLYQLTQSGGVWKENIIHAFTGQADGEHPTAGVILDQAGNLYGPAEGDINTGSPGLIFQFTPSGGDWTENVLYEFYGSTQGEYPAGGLIFDLAGNLIGTTDGNSLRRCYPCRVSGRKQLTESAKRRRKRGSRVPLQRSGAGSSVPCILTRAEQHNSGERAD